MRNRFILSAVLLIWTTIAWAYDFSAVNEIGLTIYYEIIDSKSVRVCKADYFSEIRIPSTVQYNDEVYTVTEIGDSAFMNCVEVPIVSMPNTVTKIGNKAFYWCDGLSSIKMSNALTEIGDSAFYFCRTIKTIDLPNSVTRIGCGAFNHCVWLKEINIPNSLGQIEAYTFEECDSLQTISIPKSVKSIGEMAFYGSGIRSICFCEENPLNMSVASNSFNSEYLRLYVPIGSRYAYQNASPWNYIYPDIVETTMYKFMVDWDYSRGDIFVDEPENCNGRTYIVTAEARTGYVFTGWGDGVMDNPRTVILTSDTVLRAIFGDIYSTVTVQTDNESMGSVIGGGSFKYGDTIEIEALPKVGYEFIKWSDGVTVNPRSIIVTHDTVMNAEFGDKYCSVTVLTDNESMGSVIGGGRYKYADSVEIEALPNVGYKFVGWSDGVVENPRNMVVMQDTALTAQFDEIRFVVSAIPEDETMGSVVGGGEYKQNATAELAAVALDGYRFVSWSDGVLDNPRRLVVIQDTALTAKFEPEEAYFMVTVRSADESKGTVTGGGRYKNGELADVAAIAKSGYAFARWSDGEIENPRRLNVTQDTVITAEFTEESVYYTVRVQSNDDFMGKVVGGGVFKSGATAEIAAVAEDGYIFVKWDDGITANPRTLSVVQDTIIIAVFEEQRYTLTVETENEVEGHVIGGGTYKYGETVEIAAIPERGYYFEQWSDGVADNPRLVTVKYDERIIAYFERDTTPLDEVKDNSFEVYGRDGMIEMVNAEGQVEVYDVAGRRVYIGDDVIIYVARAGVYVVRCGSEIRKVVVH